MALLGVGICLHLSLCGALYLGGYFPVSIAQVVLVLGIAGAGLSLFSLAVYLEWNLSMEDPDFHLPLLFWLLSIVVSTAIYTVEMRSLVLLSGLSLLVAVAGRLPKNQAVLFGVLASLMYGTGLVISPVVSYPLSTQEWLSWLVFTIVILFSPTAFQLEWRLLDWMVNEQQKQLKAAMDSLEQLTVRDQLTGAHNERYLNEILHYHKAMGDRRHYAFTVCTLDIDHFRNINDRLGWEQGDRVLQGFVEAFRQALREVDVLARIRDNRLVMVLSGAVEQDAATRVQRILSDLQRKQPVEGESFTVSVGVTQYRLQESVEDLLQRADQALFDARRLGRNRLIVAPHVTATPLAQPA